MSDILDRILATKRREVAKAKAAVPLQDLEEAARIATPPRDFLGAIRKKHTEGKPAVIAEIKKASPSAGQFRAEHGGDFDPARFAKSYETHGAACLSVLTDREYFQGSMLDLKAARAACTLPVLRKDFIIDPYQIVEARAAGADAVLFIIGAADISAFREWEDLAMSLGLCVLVESHSEAELLHAITLKSALIGVNNRDLTRFVTDIETSVRLKSLVPADRVLVSESGIASSQIVERMESENIHTFLIGGALMGVADPGAALAELFNNRLT